MPSTREREKGLSKVSDEGMDPAPGSGKSEIDSLRLELQQERDRSLRVRADFENFRRRVERDREVSARDARRVLLLSLVDLADSFERALAHVEESPESVLEGLHGMQRRLISVLVAEGVRSFESVGHPFDPRRHEGLATVRDQGLVPGTVVEEVGCGYLWNDELLRAARVRVAE